MVPGSVIRAAGRLLVAVLMALGATWGGAAGLREAAAGGSVGGCVAIDSMDASQTLSVLIPPMWFEVGETVSVTASDPSTGSPTRVQIALGSTGSVVVADVAYPGTASYTIPSTGLSDWIVFSVDQGDATLDLSCTCPAPATETPTVTATAPATATETSTALPTATSTSLPTSTATETAAPISTPTETAIPTIVAPTTVPAATSATVPDPTDEAEAVTGLPNTGAGPDGGSAPLATWLLLVLSALSVVGLRFWKLHRIEHQRR